MPPFERVKRIKKSFTFAWNETVKSQLALMEGLIHQIHFRVPDSVNNVAATLTIEDEDDYEIYSSGAKAENANYNLYCDPPQIVAGNFTLKVTLAGAPGVVGPPPSDPVTAVAVIYYKGTY